MNRIRIFLVDDHPIILSGLKLMLEMEENEIEISGCASSGKETLASLAELALEEQLPHVVLLDIRMPEMDGVALAKKVKENYPQVKVLVFTTFSEKQLIMESIRVGASGFLLKDSPEEELVAAIHAVHNGVLSLSAKAADLLVAGGALLAVESAELLRSLSMREREIFFLLLNGRRNKEIAEELHLSEHTVRNYISNIYACLDVSNRSSAIAWARNHGYT